MPENNVKQDLVRDINPTRLTALEKVAMPQDPEAEMSVLSAMMYDEDARSECIVRLTEEDFYTPSNRYIFKAIKTLFERNSAVDPLSVSDTLKSNRELEKAGGPNRIAELGGDPLARVGWQYHADMLHRDKTLRKMISAAAQISALAYDAPEDTKEVVDAAQKLIFDVTNADVSRSEQPISDIMGNLYRELAENANKSETELGIETGFPSVDAALLGLRPGQMIVVGARPGVGKTSFALNLAVQAAAKGASVAFFSLEMSKTEIAQRLLAASSRVSLTSIRSAKIAPDDWPRLAAASSAISNLDVMIDDTPGITVTEIRAKARRMLHGKKKGVVIIDYLQLLSPPSGQRRADSRATEVSEMSRGIKIMAKDLQVPVVALSQLNRTLENRTDKRPQLSDLRESGAIEQDADIVILLDRSMNEEEAAREKRPDIGVTNLIIAKNRSGSLADISLTFVGSSTKFVEVVSGYDDADGIAKQQEETGAYAQ